LKKPLLFLKLKQVHPKQWYVRHSLNDDLRIKYLTANHNSQPEAETPSSEEPLASTESQVEPEVRKYKKSDSDFGQLLNFWKVKEVKVEDAVPPVDVSCSEGELTM
jgi:hypothetical protein